MIAWNYRRVDISTKGSGNPGTMNIIRNFGYKKGLATLVLDVIKGAVPAVLGGLLLEYAYYDGAAFHYSVLGVYTGGLAVILGHMFPVVFKFRGGKGVACGIGVFLAADPFVMLIVFAVALVIFIIFEYGFVASLTCIFTMTLLEYLKLFTGIFDGVNLFIQADTQYAIPVAVIIGVIFVLIFVAHKQNFIRLFKGTESKVSLRGAIKKGRAEKRKEEQGKSSEN